MSGFLREVSSTQGQMPTHRKHFRWFWSRWHGPAPAYRLNWSSFLGHGISGFVSLKTWPGTQAAEYAPGKAAIFNKRSVNGGSPPAQPGAAPAASWAKALAAHCFGGGLPRWDDSTCSLAWLKGSPSPYSSSLSPACIWMSGWLLLSNQLLLSVCPWCTDSAH